MLLMKQSLISLIGILDVYNMENNNPTETWTVILVIFLIILFGGLLIYGRFFIPTNDLECMGFYAKQYCELNNMTWNGQILIPAPSGGFQCLQKIGSERIGFDEYKSNYLWTEEEINDCTIPAIIGGKK